MITAQRRWAGNGLGALPIAGPPALLTQTAIVIAVVAAGYAIAQRSELSLALAGAVVAVIAPPWVLLAGAIVAQDVLPREPIVGQLILSDLCLMAFVMRWAIARVIDSDRARLTRSRYLWLGGFLAWAWLGVVVGGSPTATALGRVTLYGAVFVAASTDRRLARPLLQLLALYAAFEAFLSLTGFTSSTGLRLLGFYGDPGVFGALMLAGVAGSMVLPFRLRLFTMPLVVSAGILTFTRATWVAMAIQGALILLPRVRRRRALIAALVAVVVALAFWAAPIVTERFGLNPHSVPLRVSSWQRAVELIRDEPVNGHGWDVGGTLGRGVAPYNLWLNTAASTGVVGALLLTGFLAAVVRDLVRVRNRVAQAGLIYVVAFLVLSLQTMTIHAAGTVTIAFFSVAGVCLAVAKQPLGPSDPRRGTSERPEADV